MNQLLPSYVLITPARNEEDFIELTIKSMVAQTLKPLKWVVVSDGSTDRTDEIVKSYLAANPWMELVRMPERRERHFGGKVLCFETGRERVKDFKHDIIGNLDGDLSFEPDLFAFLMARFAENPRLGVAGVPFNEGNGIYDFRFSSIEHVSGACQLFRRECFEAIGGYTPLKRGGIDVAAVLSARMKGWKTRTFPEKIIVHHRTMGTAKHSGLKTNFRLGEKDYSLGRHPVWQVFRAFYQMTRPPLIVGGALLLAGYCWARVKRMERPLPRELVRFQRREQMQRLKGFVARRLLFRKGGNDVSEREMEQTTVAKAG